MINNDGLINEIFSKIDEKDEENDQQILSDNEGRQS